MAKQRLERLQKVFDEAVDIMGRSEPLTDIAPKLLVLMGVALGCEWGIFWVVDPLLQRLRPVSTWHAPTVRAPQLEEGTHRRASCSQPI